MRWDALSTRHRGRSHVLSALPPYVFLSHSSESRYLGCCYQQAMSSFRVHTAPASKAIDRDDLKLIKLPGCIFLQRNKLTLLRITVHKLTTQRPPWDPHPKTAEFIPSYCIYQRLILIDRLCGPVVRVSGYRSRCPGFDSRRF
jgi:hypothetical protein